MAKPRIMFDHDGRHPLVYMYEPPMCREEFEAAVDEVAGTPVESVNLMLGDIGSLLYDSEAGSLWGRDIDRWPSHIWGRANRNFRRLIDTGDDPLLVACNRAHEKGMSLYAQLLAQQGARERSLRVWEDDDFAKDAFLYDVQPLEIGASGTVDRDWRGYRCLDYMHDEVRSNTLAVIEEVLQGYPVDGLELEFCYTPCYFRPDQVEAGRGVMTDWIGSVHEAVKRSGSDRELAVQVPLNDEAGLSIGLDVTEWIRRGIVDAVIAQPSAVADPMADFRPLVESSKGTATRVLAALKAGGVGVNMHAADYVFLMDPWWNPAAESQAIDRAHRIGRRGAVFVYRVVTIGTVEQRVRALQREKQETFEELIGKLDDRSDLAHHFESLRDLVALREDG